MVVSTDAIVYPLAVVIEFVNALVANVAMSGVTSKNCFTAWTKPISFTPLNKLFKLEL